MRKTWRYGVQDVDANKENDLTKRMICEWNLSVFVSAS